jgi:Spy/CpxP family protein refolding chaperone
LDTAQEKAQLTADRHQLIELLSKPKVEKQEALALNSKMIALKDQISEARFNSLLAASDVLTPEQKVQMENKFLLRSLKGGQQHHKFRGGAKRGNCLGAASNSKTCVRG